MAAWKVVVLVNFALLLALGVGYAAWGRRADALERDAEALRVQLERAERERRACAAGARAGEQRWEGRGLVRAAYPQLLIITHEEIRGLLPARTTSFRSALPAGAAPRLGDPVRFALQGTGAEDAAVVAVQPW